MLNELKKYEIVKELLKHLKGGSETTCPKCGGTIKNGVCTNCSYSEGDPVIMGGWSAV